MCLESLPAEPEQVLKGKTGMNAWRGQLQADRQMALTADLVASLAQVIVDAGPIPGSAEMNDDDYASLIENVLTQVPSTGLWLFSRIQQGIFADLKRPIVEQSH